MVAETRQQRRAHLRSARESWRVFFSLLPSYPTSFTSSRILLNIHSRVTFQAFGQQIIILIKHTNLLVSTLFAFFFLLQFLGGQ